MILIDTIYTNNSGGRVLLDELVNALEREDLPIFYLFDQRCQPGYDWVPGYRRKYLIPKESARRQFYQLFGNSFSLVICFSNVPPPMRVMGTVCTFFQNVILLEPSALHSLTQKFLLYVKKFYIKLAKANTDHFIVQSSHVQELVSQHLNFPITNIHTWPFFPATIQPAGFQKKPHQFLYVSDGNAHKNHHSLLEAWILIQRKYPEAVLHLTVSGNYTALQQKVEQTRLARNLNIINHGRLEKEKLLELYSQQPCIIYPSLAESFGLGLIEGMQFGCEVIAANLGYVHAVCKPLATFNPDDPVSIANEIIAFINNPPCHPVTTLAIENCMDQWVAFLKQHNAPAIIDMPLLNPVSCAV